jgi:endonuclease/exonuclease/phosphatase family metal-dependent hydrolase
MRIMTFNLRFENERDGPNAWRFRRKQVVRLIKRYAPTAVGTQEGMGSQLCYLKDHLHDYALHAPDRMEDPTCQYPTLFVHKEKYRVEEGREFWLSKTPGVHRSKDWDSAFPRMMSCARITHVETEDVFWIAVTHLDHVGVKARLEQAKIIARWVLSVDGPVILLGDFNDLPGSKVHETLTARSVGLKDTWEMLHRPENPESYTHHGFNGTPCKTRMDWILVSTHFAVRDAQIIRDHEKGRYPSDHFPYAADLYRV